MWLVFKALVILFQENVVAKDFFAKHLKYFETGKKVLRDKERGIVPLEPVIA